MINLLPLQEKQKIVLEKKTRLAIVLGIVVLVTLVCFILILLSIEFYILTGTDYQKSTLNQIKTENKNLDSVELTSVVKKYNGAVSQINSFYEKEFYINQALDIVSNIPTPKDLYLTNYLINRNNDGGLKFEISGVSGTRDDLLVFKKNIEATKEIRSPIFSPESWLSPKNANFSLVFEIYKNDK